jgi:DNA polymerase-3 subunit delta'
MMLHSQVVVTTHMHQTIKTFEELRKDETIIEIISPSIDADENSDESQPSNPAIHKIVTEKETFTVTDAKLAIEKAYMASEERTIILLAAKTFSPLVQNKLLKVIEEPPPLKEFILLTESKATILDTIRSRLPITILSEHRDEEDIGLDVSTFSLGSVYEFVQTHKRTDSQSMSILIQNIVKAVLASQKYTIDEKTLTMFSNSYMALDMGSPPQFVLNALLLKLLARKKR